MSVSYKIVSNTLPGKPEKVYYLPRMVLSGTTDLEQLAQTIAYRTTLSESDCIAAVKALESVMLEAFAEGKSVKLGEIGTFRVNIGAKVCEHPDQINSTKITKRTISYLPSKKFKNYLKNIRFTKGK